MAVPSVNSPPAKNNTPAIGVRVTAIMTGASIKIAAPSFSAGAVICINRVRNLSGK
jgi:hypothetical protein